MNKINIISFPDKLYNDSLSVLVLYPSLSVQSDLQAWLLKLESTSVNVYVYSEENYIEENFKWLLDVFKFSDLVIIDVDYISKHSNVEKILSYMISKPKTYWLTNHQHLVYSLISNNRVYDLSFLSTTGVIDDKKQ